MMTDDSPDAVQIERVLDAPAPLVWQMWTQPEHFAAWYGPNGAAIPVVEMDVRVSGTRLIRMDVNTPNGPMQMWFSGVYLEVVENKRLVYTESMSNENGEIVAPSEIGMPSDHPITTEVRIELEDVGDQTRIVITHVGIPADSPGAVGWTMALDKLAAHLGAKT